VQSDRVYVSVGIVGLSHVQAKQCTITPSLQDVRTRLSSPSKQGSNWQHQLSIASLYLWHIMTSALHHD